jgi:hypothetical protein
MEKRNSMMELIRYLRGKNEKYHPDITAIFSDMGLDLELNLGKGSSSYEYINIDPQTKRKEGEIYEIYNLRYYTKPALLFDTFREKNIIKKSGLLIAMRNKLESEELNEYFDEMITRDITIVGSDNLNFDEMSLALDCFSEIFRKKIDNYKSFRE